MVTKGRSKSRGPKSKRLRAIDRKPIRPLERQRMRPWLLDLLDKKSCDQLVWINRRDQTFRVAWKHAAGQTFDPESDATLFELWARHTGKYYTGDKPDPKKWKANFRCALNSLQDVDEDRNLGVRKGNNAFKVYKFLEEKKVKKCQQKPTVNTDENDTEESEDEYKPHYRALGTRSRPKKVVSRRDHLDSEGSEAGSGGSSPGPMDWDASEQDSQKELSPLPKFDKICPPFSKQFDTGFTVPAPRLPETHSPQANHDNDDDGSNDSPSDEDIVETISDMMSEDPNHLFWKSFIDPTTDIHDAPDIYLDSTESVLDGPSVIVETETTLMHDYHFTSLQMSQL